MEYSLSRHYYGSINNNESSNMLGMHNDESIIIMSEFVSSARIMRGSIIINPWKIDEVYYSNLFNLSTNFINCIIAQN